MALTPQQVSEKKFTSTRFKNGYDETEVDAFLDTVEAELTRLLDEQASLRGELEAARSAPAPVDTSGPAPVSAGQSEMEELLRRTLLLGQRTADEAVAEARAEAARLKAEAYSEAEAARIDSERRIADTERAAALRHSTALAEHEAVRQQLEDATEALRVFEADYRGRLRSYLELQLRDLDAAVLAPPGAAPSASSYTGPADTSAPVIPPQSGDAAAATLEAAAASMASPSDVELPTGPEDVAADSELVDSDAVESGSVASEPAETALASEPAAESSPYSPAPSDVVVPAPAPTPALPALPPLPEWMSADAGFGTPTPPAPGNHGE